MTESASFPQEQSSLERAIKELGTQITAILPVMEEGAQVWDHSSRLIYANPITCDHFGGIEIDEGDSCRQLIESCLSENGFPFPIEEFPVSRVIETGQPCTGFMMQVASNHVRWLRVNAYPIHSEKAELSGVLSTSHDLTDIVEKGLRAEQDAQYDPLTGLPNRILMPDRMKLALAHSDRTGETLAICLMDLDGFKPINDTLGHAAGDLVLKALAPRLESVLRQEDSAIRFGGDEFVLLIGGLLSERECELAVNRVLNAISTPFEIMGNKVRITASIGVTLYPNDYCSAEQLLRHADRAMYKAKESGKNCYHMFDTTLEARLRANKGIIKRIRKALSENQLLLYYQPKVDCLQGEVLGVEALIRWDHPVLGLRPPAEFLPLIENDNLIIQIGDWVLEQVMQQVEKWHQRGLDLRVSVNIATRQILQPEFGDRLERLSADYPDLPPNHLEIEILEGAALEDMNAVGSLMERFQSTGISFALDDFGTGHSSLTHLKYLAADALKIDQKFVHGMLFDPGDLAIVQGVIGLAHAFQQQVVAEGVESIDQALALIEMGCHILQGHSIARPMPAKKIPKWMKRFKADPRWRLAHNHYPTRTHFELLLIEATHRHWLDRLMSAATQPTIALEPQDINYENCPLTHWYQRTGLSKYGDLPDIGRIEELHREVHPLGESLLDCDPYSDPELAASLHRELAIANEKLLQELRRFRIDTLSHRSNKRRGAPPS